MFSIIVNFIYVPLVGLEYCSKESSKHLILRTGEVAIKLPQMQLTRAAARALFSRLDEHCRLSKADSLSRHELVEKVKVLSSGKVSSA